MNKLKELVMFWLRPSRRKSGSASIGIFDLVGAVAIFTLIGIGLDYKLKTTPLLSVILCFFGIIGGSISMFYKYKHSTELHDKDKPWGKT